MSHVFISYKREDLGPARALRDLLVNRLHCRVFWDQDLQCGGAWSGALDDALARAACVVVMWSQNSVGSSWVQQEAAVGRVLGKLVPVAIDDSEVPESFAQVQTAKLTGLATGSLDDADTDLTRMLDAVASHVDEPSMASRVVAVAANSAVAVIGMMSGVAFLYPTGVPSPWVGFEVLQASAEPLFLLLGIAEVVGSLTLLTPRVVLEQSRLPDLRGAAQAGFLLVALGAVLFNVWILVTGDPLQGLTTSPALEDRVLPITASVVFLVVALTALATHLEGVRSLPWRLLRNWQATAFQRGQAEGMRQNLIALLEARFGPLDGSARLRIRRARDAKLEAWTASVLTASSVDDVLAR